MVAQRPKNSSPQAAGSEQRVVTKDDVREALQAFLRRGVVRPGLHRLRAEIGRGSFARIRRFVNEIDDENYERLSGKQVAKLPDPISAAAAKLWAEIEEASESLQTSIEKQLYDAQGLMEEERKARTLEGAENARRIREIEERLATTNQALQQAEHRLRELEPAFAVASSSLERLTRELEAAKEAGRARELTLTQRLKAERDEFNAESLERRREMEDVRKELAEARATAKEELEEARREARSDEQAARKREDELRAEAYVLQVEVSKAKEAHAGALALLAQREASNKQLAGEREKLRAQVAALEQDMARSEARQDAQGEELAELRGALKAARQYIEDITKQMAEHRGRKAKRTPGRSSQETTG